MMQTTSSRPAARDDLLRQPDALLEINNRIAAAARQAGVTSTTIDESSFEQLLAARRIYQDPSGRVWLTDVARLGGELATQLQRQPFQSLSEYIKRIHQDYCSEQPERWAGLS